MNNFSLFLARRFFHQSGVSEGGRKHFASTPAIRIATAGIAVGLAVMIVSVSVVKGFQREVSAKLSGFASHIEVCDVQSFSSPETFPVVTDSALVATVRRAPGVKHVQRVGAKIGIFKTHNDFAGVALKGVAEDYDLNFIRSQLVAGRVPAFTDKKSTNRIVISKTLSERLGLKVGDKVYSYYFAQTIKQRRLEVAGIYETHLKQFDETFVLTDLYTVRKLNNWDEDQSTGLEVTLDSYDELPAAQAYLAKAVGGKKDRVGRSYSVIGIDENPRTASVLSWLNLLDFNVMVILIIMVSVAGFTMISGLLILILERTSTIGLLKALGASNRRIRYTFLWFAAFIVGRGLLVGNVIGLLLVGSQALFGWVHLNPETYYVDAVPVAINWWWIVGLNAASLVVTILALIVPSLLVSSVQPAKAIQFD